MTGVASTVVGSWISSKIHIYHENRRVHLEEIKQKVLIPISDFLTNDYAMLVPTPSRKTPTSNRASQPSPPT